SLPLLLTASASRSVSAYAAEYPARTSPCQRFGTAHGFRSRVGGLSEPCQSDEADRDQSALGRGYHLPSPEEGACLPGCDSRRVCAESGGLGVGSHAGKPVAASGTAASNRGTKAAARLGASLGSRCAVCVWRIREGFA